MEPGSFEREGIYKAGRRTRDSVHGVVGKRALGSLPYWTEGAIIQINAKKATPIFGRGKKKGRKGSCGLGLKALRKKKASGEGKKSRILESEKKMRERAKAALRLIWGMEKEREQSKNS